MSSSRQLCDISCGKDFLNTLMLSKVLKKSPFLFWDRKNRSKLTSLKT